VQGAQSRWQYCGVTALFTFASHRYPANPGRAWPRWAAAVLAALLLHAALLAGWNARGQAPQRLGVAHAVSVRWLPAPEREADARAAPDASAQATHQASAQVARASALAPAMALAAAQGRPARGGATPAAVAGPVAAGPPPKPRSQPQPAMGVAGLKTSSVMSPAAPAPPTKPPMAPPLRGQPALTAAPTADALTVATTAATLATAASVGPVGMTATKDKAAAPSPALIAAPDAELADETWAIATPPPAGQVVPTYRTTWAPASSLSYSVRRGAAQGQLQLNWAPVAEQGRYELALRSHSWVGARGQPVKDPPMQWTSKGQFDAAGLAPERFTVARRGRERHAANFQRDKGLVTYAGPAAQWPLAAGMQDRLSWMLQLGAILQAQPALAAPGQQVHLWVVGAHGDAAVWTFTVASANAESHTPPAVLSPPTATPHNGPAQQASLARPLPEGGALAPTAGTVLLRREATHAHDSQVQVWLDPARHHLPVRVVFRQQASAQSTELWLHTLQAP
jgi:hypothetical protein